MDEIDLESRFPEMQPVRKPPSLVSVNGCGLRAYGSRDLDHETGTYVKTQCICLFYIPILALRAFRVVDAEGGGWYCIGREPLSAFAKAWNFLVLGGVASLAGILCWNAYTNSPDYRAGQQLAMADDFAANGKWVKAVRLYLTVTNSGTRHAPQAANALKDLLDGLVGQASAQDVAAVLDIVVRKVRRSRAPPIVPDVLERGLALVDRFAETDPHGALAILEVIAPLVTVAEALVAKREQVLERAVAHEPNDPEPASKLALIYEGRGELERCEGLLDPHRDRLGDTEGARILGQLDAARGEVEASFALLAPYCEGRLERLHGAEQAYNNAAELAWKRAVGRLEKGQGPESFYRQYKAASEDEQQALVQEYVEKQIRGDAGIRMKQEALIREASVVPVALDLGMVRLHRAQAMPDPQARQDELQAAEETFLAIRGLAGDTDQYRLFFGQVCYWLGKHDQGRELFDELLTVNQRSCETLMSVSSTLRDLGACSEARELAEEAYNKEADQGKKYEAALLRALLPTDSDDQIEWYRRANPADPHVKAALSMALGNRAIQEGDNRGAARHLHQAIAAYEQQAPTTATLNNAALAYFSLFQATGEPEGHDKGVQMLERAVALEPSNSILLYNAATTLLTGALSDIIGDAIDLKTLNFEGDFSLLSFLYEDAAGRAPFRQRVRSHADVARALAYFGKLLVLRPKDVNVYAAVAAIHKYTRDIEAMQDLRQRLQQVELDLTEARRRTLDFYAGTDDPKRRRESEASIERFEKLVNITRGQSPGATFAVAATYLATARMAVDILGISPDADDIVALVEEAHAVAPSSATRRTLVAALLFRAGQTLARQDAAYAEMASRAGRSLAPIYLVAVALTRPDEQRDAALNNADVRRAVSLLLEDSQAFPAEGISWDWAMLRAGQPDEAARVASTVRQDEVRRIGRAIDLLLSPMSATAAFDAYWSALIDGNEDEGAEILRRSAARGVPMPFDP